MLAKQLLLLALLPLIQAQETVLGVYIFHRHGDRTSKAWPPTNLTDLGYTEVYESGNYFRNRYITGASKIHGVSQNIVKNSQLNVQAPVDVVLQSSAQGFLQGLYPPVGSTLGTQTLANGTKVQAPLNGYQLIPINAVTAVSGGTNSENTAWLQGASGCANAIFSSNNYFISDDFISLANSTQSFYQGLNPVVNGSFAASYVTYKNAYSSKYLKCPLFRVMLTIPVFDLIHVATIDNATINSSYLLTTETLFQLQTLADHHEFELAYNSSDTIRAVAGSTLAAQIVQQLNSTIVGKSASKFGIQFGAYGSFSSFFGLSQLNLFSPNFTAIVDYASSMTFELVTNSTVSSTSYPNASDIYVRFLFSNGSAAYNPLVAYPLFNQSSTLLPWSTFVTSMDKFAIGSQTAWCSACGNSTGVCASTTTSSPTSATSSAGSSSTSGSSSSSSSGGGMSLAVAGVIGAMVTLAVILGLEGLILLLAGLRVVSKRRLGGSPAATAASGSPVKSGN